MRGLSGCFVILSLALVSGALVNEESNVYVKNFDFGEKLIVVTISSFYEDELIYVACEADDAVKKCKIYGESTSADKKTVRACDLNLTYTNLRDFKVNIFYGDNSRAFIVIPDGDDKVKLININLKSCHSKETSIVTSALLYHIYVVPHENNYDVIYKKNKTREDFYKATVDYEGKVVKAASVFNIKNDVTLMNIKGINTGYVIGATFKDNHNEIYFVKDGESNAKTLFQSKEGHIRHTFFMSTKKNKITFCPGSYKQIICSQYDADGNNKIAEAKLAFANSDMDRFDLFNLEKGFLVATAEHKATDEGAHVSVMHFDEHDKKGKSVYFDFNCDKEHITILRLYRNAKDEHCITTYCFTINQNIPTGIFNKFFSESRCFSKTELV